MSWIQRKAYNSSVTNPTALKRLACTKKSTNDEPPNQPSTKENSLTTAKCMLHFAQKVSTKKKQCKYECQHKD